MDSEQPENGIAFGNESSETEEHFRFVSDDVPFETGLSDQDDGDIANESRIWKAAGVGTDSSWLRSSSAAGSETKTDDPVGDGD